MPRRKCFVYGMEIIFTTIFYNQRFIAVLKFIICIRPTKNIYSEAKIIVNLICFHTIIHQSRSDAFCYISVTSFEYLKLGIVDRIVAVGFSKVRPQCKWLIFLDGGSVSDLFNKNIFSCTKYKVLVVGSLELPFLSAT